MPMLRKAGIALLALALMLVGIQPFSAPGVGTIAVASEAQQPCCLDCDEPAMPADAGCSMMVGCMTATPWGTLPKLGAVSVSYPARLVLLPPTQSPPVAMGVSPPFRPPRLPILT